MPRFFIDMGFAAEADRVQYRMSVSSARFVSPHLGFAAVSSGNDAPPGAKPQIAAEAGSLAV